MNWGWRIVVVYLIFAAFIGTAVYIMLSQDVHLVTENYYQQEIEYQKSIDAHRNGLTLGSTFGFVHNPDSNTLKVFFPEKFKKIDGQIYFYRPNDPSKDLIIPTRTSGGTQEFSLSTFDKGNWDVKITFVHNNKTYYKEGSITIELPQ